MLPPLLPHCQRLPGSLQLLAQGLLAAPQPAGNEAQWAAEAALGPRQRGCPKTRCAAAAAAAVCRAPTDQNVLVVLPVCRLPAGN